jgi:hypothetical protein
MTTQLQLPIVEQTYEETLGLLGEARDWVEQNINSDDRPPPNERFNIVTHQCRVVTRLEWVMAWLMFRKAVSIGEINEPHALEEREPLNGQKYYLTQHDRTISYLPQRLEQLLDSSHELYARVARLDAMIRDFYFSTDSATEYSPLPN